MPYFEQFLPLILLWAWQQTIGKLNVAALIFSKFSANNRLTKQYGQPGHVRKTNQTAKLFTSSYVIFPKVVSVNLSPALMGKHCEIPPYLAYFLDVSCK